MPIEIDGVEHRTEKQWERVHRHVKKGAKGVYREWKSPRGGKDGATFYPRADTVEYTQAEKDKANKKRREAEAERKVKKRIAEAVEQARKDEWEQASVYYRRIIAEMDIGNAVACTGAPSWFEKSDYITAPKTAGEWVEGGFVPLDTARWWTRDDVYRCCWWDVRYNEDRADELEKTKPAEDGDGLPWWQARVDAE